MVPGDVTAPASGGAAAKRGTIAAFALVWLAAFAFLSEGGATFLAMALLLTGVALPCWLLLTRVLARALEDEGLARVFGAAATLVVLTPLYLLRKAVPWPAPVGDAVIASLAWLLVWRTRALRGSGPGLRSLLGNAERVYVAVLLPAVFCLSWIGYAVRGAEAVDFLGLYYVDFGALLSIQNMVRASEILPTWPVLHSGPLGYHWLYFAFPAWASEFAGLPAQSANALVMANLVTASLLYLMLARTCARALRAAALFVDSTKLAPHLAGLALFALSTLYGYQAAVGWLHRSWFTLGTRNHLLLQLPHSLDSFGNNTLALVFCLLIAELLICWRASGKRSGLALAAVLASILPGYSVFLVFPVGLGIFGWAILGQARRPVLTLATFGAFAAVALAIFRAIGLFSHGTGGAAMTVSFDSGHFVQNVALGFLPVTLALAICLFHVGKRKVFANLSPYLCLMLACLVVPTMLMTHGSLTSRVDFSMKTASLYLVAAVPFFAVASAWLLSHWRQHRFLGLAGLALVCGGLVNSGAYVLQHAVHRVLGRQSAAHGQAIPIDHYRALELVARQPARLIVLDELSIANSVLDPAVMLGGKRVLVDSVYPQSAAAKENKALWLAWQSGGFVDETVAARLAERADLLITTPRVRSPSWTLMATFGNVAVYRSTLRPAL